MAGPIDTKTGAVHFDDLTLVIVPGLELRAFEAHPERGRFTAGQKRRVYADFVINVSLDGTAFQTIVGFVEGVVDSVGLTASDPAVSGTSWDDYDPAVLRRFNDEWLEQRLGRGKPWQA